MSQEPPVHLSVHLPTVCPSICLAVHLSIHPSVHMSVRLSVCSSIQCLSIHPPVCPSIWQGTEIQPGQDCALEGTPVPTPNTQNGTRNLGKTLLFSLGKDTASLMVGAVL